MKRTRTGDVLAIIGMAVTLVVAYLAITAVIG